MNPLVIAYVASMLFSAAVASGLAIRVSRRRDRPGGGLFALALSGVAVWTAAQAFANVTTWTPWSVFWFRTTFVGSAVAGVALLLFTLAYTGREHLVTRRTVALVVAEPVVAVLLVFTNGRHGLTHHRIAPHPEFGRLVVVENALGTFVHVVYMSVLLAISTVLLLQLCYRARDLYRRQAIAIVVAVGLPWFGSLVDAVVTPTFTVSEPSFAVSVSALYVGLFRYDLIEVPPVARGGILETVSEGVLVVNGQDRLAEFNPAAERLLGVDDAVVGRPVTDVLSEFPDLVATIEGETGEGQVTVSTADGERHLTVERATMGDRGSVYLLTDVTERLRRERELERQNDRLDQFASVVSHDVRNPLAVADGYAQTLESRLDGEEQDLLDEVRTSHDRIESIVDDVLTLTRQGAENVDTGPVSLEAVAREAWAQVATDGATLEVDVELTVVADRSRLKRALENLFRNSREHGGEDVTVRLRPIEDGFAVADDGPGIPEEEREAALDPGYSTTIEGNGFGLAIVDDVAEAHDWTLTLAESEAGGARFEFRGLTTAPELRTDGSASEESPR